MKRKAPRYDFDGGRYEFDETTVRCSCGNSITPGAGFIGRKRKILRCPCGQDIGFEVKKVDRKTITIEPCNKTMKFFRIDLPPVIEQAGEEVQP